MSFFERFDLCERSICHETSLPQAEPIGSSVRAGAGAGIMTVVSDWRTWPTRTSVLALMAPVGLFGVAFAATASGSLARRAGLLPLSLVLGLALLGVPLIFLVVFVRTSGLFVASLLAFSVSVPVALVNVATDEHSTAGLQMLWTTYIASITVLIAATLDAIPRHHRRARMRERDG